MTQRPNWFHRIDISRCEEHFNKVEAFAIESGRHDQLMETLGRLCASDIPDEELTWFCSPLKGMRVTLYKDFAPHSFEFSKQIQRAGRDDWEPQLFGGIIFHGAHDNGGDGSAPTFSTNLNPHDGWSVHT